MNINSRQRNRSLGKPEATSLVLDNNKSKYIEA